MLDAKQSAKVRQAVADAIAKGGSEEEIANEVLTSLVRLKVALFDQHDPVPLFSSAGRVLTSIIRDPEATIRSIASRTSLGESSVARTISSLVNRGLVERSRVGSRNVYRIDQQRVLEHPDTVMFAESILGLVGDY